MSNLDLEIQRRFKCGKCRGTSATIHRIATTGSGFTRFIDRQRTVFIAVSCTRCGYTETYDRAALEGRDRATEILDLLFGLGE